METRRIPTVSNTVMESQRVCCGEMVLISQSVLHVYVRLNMVPGISYMLSSIPAFLGRGMPPLMLFPGRQLKQDQALPGGQVVPCRPPSRNAQGYISRRAGSVKDRSHRTGSRQRVHNSRCRRSLRSPHHIRRQGSSRSSRPSLPLLFCLRHNTRKLAGCCGEIGLRYDRRDHGYAVRPCIDRPAGIARPYPPDGDDRDPDR